MSHEERDRENGVVLQLVQAMLGLISTNMRAVAIEINPPVILLHFAVLSSDPESWQDAHDIASDLDALLCGDESVADIDKIDVRLHLGSPDQNWSGRSHRLVYVAKP